MIETLVEAANAARSFSVDGRDIEIVVIEEGFLVRGRVDLRTCWWHSSIEIRFEEFEACRSTLGNAVALVRDRLVDKKLAEADRDRTEP